MNNTEFSRESACLPESRTLGWLGLIVLFLCIGVIGHDPWKQDETYSFGIIYHFYTTHTWLVPVNAGMPFMEKPPLYYWSAVIFCKIFSGVMPLHDAARLTSILYMSITCVFLWKLSQSLFHNHPERRATGWMTLSLLLGTVGMVRHAHDMFTDVALLTGTTITLYGMSLMIAENMSWKRAGLWLGLGIGIAFLSKGFLVPAILGISGIVLWCLMPLLRTRQTFFASLLALLIASPFLFIWPFMLYQDSHALFMQWLWENNVGRFFGFSVHHLGADNKQHYILYTILWFAFPVFPLACITALHDYIHWRQPEYLLPLTVLLVGFIMLLISASARALYLIPLMPACALLATQALFYIPGKILHIWNVSARFLFSLAGIGLWFAWFSLLQPVDHQPIAAFSEMLKQWLPLGFVPVGNQWPFYAIALIVSLFWIYSMHFRANTPLNTAKIGFAGTLLVWGISHSLLLPWIDETKSYRPVLESMNQYISASPYAHDCISNDYLGESISPMLQYFGHQLKPAPIQTFHTATCRLLLLTTTKETEEDIHSGWKMVWKGSRILDTKNDELRLYARTEHAKQN